MDIDQLLSDLKSGDIGKTRSASCKILHLSKDEISLFPVKEVKRIRKAIKKLPPDTPLPEKFRHEFPKVAVSILEALEKELCRCSAYVKAQRFLPEEEVRLGYILIEEKDDIPWEPEFRCKCLGCGRKYFVHESHSYHYPWAKWSIIT